MESELLRNSGCQKLTKVVQEEFVSAGSSQAGLRLTKRSKPVKVSS